MPAHHQLRLVGALLLLFMQSQFACSSSPEPAPVATKDYPASQNTCVPDCNWPNRLPDSLRDPVAAQFANDELRRLHSHLETVVGVPETQCLCLELLLARSGGLANVTIVSSTNEVTSRAVEAALRSAPAGAPIPSGAACLASTPIPASLGGARR